jgi:hypothetical protein
VARVPLLTLDIYILYVTAASLSPKLGRSLARAAASSSPTRRCFRSRCAMQSRSSRTPNNLLDRCIERFSSSSSWASHCHSRASDRPRSMAPGATEPSPSLRSGPSPPIKGDDRFCNRIAAVKPLFLLWLMSQVDPKPSFRTPLADGGGRRKAAIQVSPRGPVIESANGFSRT